MDLEQIKETDLWQLYQKGRNYLSMRNVFSDTDKNYRFYNGNQWGTLTIKGIENVQLNFIKPIVKYKVATINSNQWAINYSSDNIESEEFKKQANEICEMLNKKANKIWDIDKMDYKVRTVSKDSAINDEGIMYCDYSIDDEMPRNEILTKNDVYYGNENDSDMQSQPYIIIKRRMPVSSVQEMARDLVPAERLELIKGDGDTFQEAGDDSKQELDDMCTVLIKMYKENGTVHYEKATRCCVLEKEQDTGLSLYPIAHLVWEEKRGSARGEGEVRNLIANQIEVNKTVMRELVTVKMTAYPTRIVNTEKIANPGDAGKIGATLRTKNGMTVDDVTKAVGVIQPAHMSGDVEQLKQDIITKSRELAGAGDIATGDVNPESASGRAILAVQQASQQPLVEQLTALKTFIEDIARIWLDLIITYSKDGITLEQEITDEITGEENTQPITVDKETLEQLKATVKVDITPKGAYDKFAQESSLENMFKAGMFNVQKLPELKVYTKLLDDDSVMPKQKLEEAIDYIEEEQQKVAMINNQAQMLRQQASQFIDGDVDTQSSMINEAQQVPQEVVEQ